MQEEIKEVLGEDILFFNGAPNLAKHLKEVLEENNLLGKNEGKIEFLDSQNSKKKEKRFYQYLKEEKQLEFNPNIEYEGEEE